MTRLDCESSGTEPLVGRRKIDLTQCVVKGQLVPRTAEVWFRINMPLLKGGYLYLKSSVKAKLSYLLVFWYLPNYYLKPAIFILIVSKKNTIHRGPQTYKSKANCFYNPSINQFSLSKMKPGLSGLFFSGFFHLRALINDSFQGSAESNNLYFKSCIKKTLIYTLGWSITMTATELF